MATVPSSMNEASDRDPLRRRERAHLCANDSHGAAIYLLAALLEARAFSFLQPEQPHHADARYRFGENAGESACGLLQLRGRAPHSATERAHDKDHCGSNCEATKADLPGEGEHSHKPTHYHGGRAE